MACVQNKPLGTRVTLWIRQPWWCRARAKIGIWLAGPKFKIEQPWGEPVCSFCGTVYDATDTIVPLAPLVEGPLDVFICRRCVTHAEAVFLGLERKNRAVLN